MRPLCLTAAVIALFAPAAPAQVAPSYRLTDLSPLSTSVWGRMVNDSGQVAAWAMVSPPTPAVSHIFRTSPAGQPLSFTDFGGLPGAGESLAHAINAAGQVAGESGTSPATTRLVRSSPNGQPPSLTDLGNLSFEARATGINNLGEISGWSSPGVGNVRAIRSSPNGAPNALTDLGTLGGTISRGYGINDLGQVAGEATNTFGLLRAFRSTPTGQPNALTDLGTLPGGFSSSARGIDPAGRVVGFSTVTGGQEHAFRSTPTGQAVALTDLGTAGFAHSHAYGINALGVIVGAVGNTLSPFPRDRAFVYDDVSGMVDLTSRLDPATGAGWTLNVGLSVSDTGFITALGTRGTTPALLVLLTPVPEPSALALAGLGAVGGAAAWRRRRQTPR